MSLALWPANITQDYEVHEWRHATAIRMQVKLEKSVLANASKVMLTKDGDAVKVTLSEQDIREQYPWDYGDLCKRLGARYTDFKQNQDFHDIRLSLMKDDKYTKARYLDPGNPKSSKKDFYNGNVLQVFDQHYTRK